MKKIILSLTALLAFSIASAQTEPKTTKNPANQTPTTTTQPDKTAVGGAVVDDKNKKGSDGEMIQPRKDEMKTTDHVKSTPATGTMTDTTTTNNAKRPKRLKKA